MVLSANSAGSALATTIGPLTVAAGGAILQGAERARIARWREDLWQQLERRAGVLAPREADAWYEHLVYEQWRTSAATGGLPPIALSIFYRMKRLIPRSLQLALRRALIKRQGLPEFPEWPFESAGNDLLRIAFADALLERGVDTLRFPWFWPQGRVAAAILTHDVESADGLERSPAVASWEEQQGLRSSFNIVSDWYPIDTGVLDQLRARGHEIGSHAIHHDRSLFASRASFEQQLPMLKEAARRLGAVGFRSPATHRVVEWLGELPFSYDCTMPHSDPYEPIPGGTATVWPFFHGEVVELPYTAPQDHTLFNLLGHGDCSLWQEQLERVVSCNGLFQVVTHPDAEYLGREAIRRSYCSLLETLAGKEDVWVALPGDVASWWRARANGLTPTDDGRARWTGSTVEIEPDPILEGKSS